jgi:amidohydrolase
VTALQTVVSRQTNLTVGPAVVTVGALNGGVRNNIIPDSAVMVGTIRTFDPEQRRQLHAQLRRTVDMAVQAQGATARIDIEEMTPVTANQPALTERMVATLRRVAGPAGVSEGRPVTGSEDFGYFAERARGCSSSSACGPRGARTRRS